MFLRKEFVFVGMLLVFFYTVFFNINFVYSHEKESCSSFFYDSLHSTTRGMKFWYSKENGGLELLTQKAYDQLSCKKCHVESCDVCHKVVKNESSFYSCEIARKKETCLKCHGREKSIFNVDKKENNLDVHIAAGMVCMDCHTLEEVHGNGINYVSMKEKGAIKVRCETCHGSREESDSHLVHKGKLDCKACHTRHVFSCINCHFDTLVKQGKKVFIPLYGWTFLINYEGKVTAANVQTFVVEGKKTFLLFAPQHSHSIMSKGRGCKDCHATDISKRVFKNEDIQLTWLQDGDTCNLKGVIPVSKDVFYGFVYQNYKNGKWIPIRKPHEPLVHYVGFGTPLSANQLLSLAKQH